MISSFLSIRVIVFLISSSPFFICFRNPKSIYNENLFSFVFSFWFYCCSFSINLISNYATFVAFSFSYFCFLDIIHLNWFDELLLCNFPFFSFFHSNINYKSFKNENRIKNASDTAYSYTVIFRYIGKDSSNITQDHIQVNFLYNFFQYQDKAFLLVYIYLLHNNQ